MIWCARIVRARSEKGFLKALPSATHVLTWHFRSEWFALAPRLRLLATPAAGRELVPKEGPPGVTIHFGGFHGGVMAESVLAMMLAWCRGVVAAERLGPWPKIALSGMCYRLAGTRAGRKRRRDQTDLRILGARDQDDRRVSNRLPRRRVQRPRLRSRRG